MLLPILIATASAAPTPLEMSVSSASLFKNGYAVVVHEGKLRGSGEYLIDDLPMAVLGTMWLTASPGVKLSRVLMTSEETSSETPAQSLDEILRANVGRRLKFFLNDKTELEGTLESADGAILVIRSSTEMRVLPKSAVAQISAPGGDVVWKIKSKSTKPVIRFTATAGADSKFYMVSMERGLTWTPGYSIDITDKNDLHLVAKATIMDDLAELKGVEVRLITGFPNVPFLGYWDPFTSRQSVDQFVGGVMQMGTPAQLRDKAGVGGMMNQMAPAPGTFDDAFDVSALPGLSEEDLFFYRLPDVTMKKGDRGYYILFSAKSSYSHIYEWDIPDKINAPSSDRPGDVWHSLKFKNTAKQPLTTAPATIFKDGEILGQDMLMYTSVGADALVKMTKALDVRAEDLEEEVERKAVEQPVRGSYYDLVTLKGTLSVHNRKTEPIKLKITKELTGEMISTDGNPKVRAITKGLRAVNPRHLLEWTIDLKPDEKRVLTYSYRLYIPR
ncbi:MAG: DUF4139 domain-containing protein [Armatimonadetes bacterium]|nr:DUF4139 domain-containing protein [Armatimonadota bacterium]